jgi:hypothetical protein
MTSLYMNTAYNCILACSTALTLSHNLVSSIFRHPFKRDYKHSATQALQH